jgi:hypothetical protein
MPIHLYRLTWKNSNNQIEEYWSSSFQLADDKKFEIDHNETLKILGFLPRKIRQIYDEVISLIKANSR